MEKPLTVLEFYSGIGGMHYALDQTNIPYEVIGAFDINTTANMVYKHNFPCTKLFQKNIDGFTVEYLEEFNADIWTMSPPCQPYTRQGKQQASGDNRAKSFLNLLSILKKMKNPPKKIFMENVKGFECSDTRDLFSQSLKFRDYEFQEFMISPKDLGIPNSRTRYYMIAKHKETFCCTPTLIPLSFDEDDDEESCFAKELKLRSSNCPVQKISEFINNDSVDETFFLSENVLAKYHSIFDIVTPDSLKSCCFTKAYGKYIEGTGSVFTDCSTNEIEKVYHSVSMTECSDEKSRLLSTLRLRYFTPHEIGKLMSFPESFDFPDLTTTKQKYRLLGNSVNVYVISFLMKWFML